MSAPFIIPFNFQPETVEVKTASYPIPAGKYAYVVANVEGTGTFTIGGTTALRGTSNTVLSGSVLDYNTDTGANQLIVTSGASLAPDGNAFSSSTHGTTVAVGYWLPSGTTIAGTGTWRAVVSLYSNIQ